MQAIAAQILLGIAGLALITFACFQLGFGLARTGFAYVIVIALVSLLGSFSASIVLSIVAAACLNYFFAAPLFEFRHRYSGRYREDRDVLNDVAGRNGASDKG